MSVSESLILKETLRQSSLFMFSIVAPCCSGSTTVCSFSDLRLVPTSACWKVCMVRLPDDGAFWKNDFPLFIDQTPHKNSFPISICQKCFHKVLKNLHEESDQVCFLKHLAYNTVISTFHQGQFPGSFLKITEQLFYRFLANSHHP